MNKEVHWKPVVKVGFGGVDQRVRDRSAGPTAQREQQTGMYRPHSLYSLALYAVLYLVCLDSLEPEQGSFSTPLISFYQKTFIFAFIL
jgi:hypothetical protein